jgi:hypothetical protein
MFKNIALAQISIIAVSTELPPVPTLVSVSYGASLESIIQGTADTIAEWLDKRNAHRECRPSKPDVTRFFHHQLLQFTGAALDRMGDAHESEPMLIYECHSFDLWYQLTAVARR